MESETLQPLPAKELQWDKFMSSLLKGLTQTEEPQYKYDNPAPQQ